MRKIFSTMMLVAAAAMAFVSCQKNEDAPKYEQTVLTFASTNPNTKTEWNGETIIWSAGDKIKMALKIGDSWYADANDKVKYYVSKETYLSDDSQTAQFEISVSFDTDLSGNYQFYALYPSSCTGSSTDFTKVPNATYTIASEQLASSQTFDKSADILWGKAEKTYTYLPKGEQISLMWNRLVAHAYITLKGLPVGETINKVTLTAQNDAALVGKYDVDITTGAVSENTPANSVVVNCEAVTVGQDGSASFWACINPCKVTSLNIVVDTDKAVYSIDKTNLDLDFLVNKRNIQPVNMSAAVRTPKDLTGAELPFEETFESCTTTSNSALEVLDGFASVLNVYPNSGAVKFATGEKNAALTTKLLDLSSPFYVKVLARGYDEDEVTLTVKAGEQSKVITMVTFGSTSGDFVEYIVNFEAVDNSESVIFETAAGKRLFIDNIYIGEGSAVAAPMIVAQTPAKVAANGGAGEIVYTVYNEVEGVNLTAESNQSWLTIDSTTGGKVAFTAAANDVTEERTATVTLTYGAVTAVVSVIQEAKVEGTETPTEGFVLVTSLAEVTTGEYVVAANVNGTYYAMSKSLAASISGKAVNVSDNMISLDDAQDYVVTITRNGNDVTIKGGDKWLAVASSGTDLKTQTSSYNWTLSEGNITGKGKFKLVASGKTDNGLHYRASSYNVFKGYKSTNVKTTNEYYNLELFKKTSN